MAKKSLRTLIGASLLAAASLVQADDPRVVAITQIVEHPALDAVHEGVKDELAERGYRCRGRRSLLRRAFEWLQMQIILHGSRFDGLWCVEIGY